MKCFRPLLASVYHETITSIYYKTINGQYTRLIERFEPLIMILLALVIGSLVIAMYLPLFQMGSVL
ncbi:hypothetical protein [Candidatus Coxiella mudrowiae]|uniref:hypothetical protein n=1 Tax=Candidatus Coxiella mudrowiae TaxID=2054173 RepID=UPI0006622BDE|nr:hypothetical protein [Candidatus Coxiella mudrowiae]